jgi:hypothetical protein
MYVVLLNETIVYKNNFECETVCHPLQFLNESLESVFRR